jgi:hypothetical protein
LVIAAHHQISLSMSCEQLSPSAAAFSTMLSAFVGSVLNGLFSGFWIAFFTGWISWLAVFRILAAGFYELWISIRAGTNYETAGKEDAKYHSIGNNINMTGFGGHQNTTVQSDEEHLAQNPPPYTLTPTGAILDPNGNAIPRKNILITKPPTRTVDTFGWLAWTYAAIYTPLSHTIWLAVHITSSNGPLLLVRALAIGVSALSLTFDTKQRYAASLQRGWFFLLFNLWNALACTLLGMYALILLIRGAINLKANDDNMPIVPFIVYPIFSTIWAAVSWRALPPMDGARPGINIFADVAMGVFAGVFVAAPAGVLWQSAKFNASVDEMMHGTGESGVGLGEYLACNGASFWGKVAAVIP